MSAHQPRSRPPSVAFDGRLTRYLGRRDDADDLPDCPECGSHRRDLWSDEGAVTARVRCVDCGASYETEVGR